MPDINTLVVFFLCFIGAPLLVGMALFGILGEIRLWVIDLLFYNKAVKLEKDLDHANEVIERLEVLIKANKGSNKELSLKLVKIKEELYLINQFIEEMKEEN